ncbi:MAG: SDR family NAD(P)-dependent oxidoreductase, partial [Kangiellaceae bacterium]|nr:SDR family NAD(P)-dependent oxidoreductase [Kangiellaceae bacterium]
MYQYQAPHDLLKDKVILVTGASAGIGEAIAKSYAAHGATVILHGRKVDKLEAIYDEIIAQGGPQPAILPVDLQNPAQQQYQSLADTIRSELGRLDGILHNAAMISELTPIEFTETNVWHEMMQVNVNSVFMLTQACLPLLKEAENASIITTSSGVGKKGRAFWG